MWHRSPFNNSIELPAQKAKQRISTFQTSYRVGAMEREKAKGKRQKAKEKREKAKGKRQKAKGKRQKAKGKRQKAEGRRQKVNSY
jgi:hypothetical protein